MRIIMYLVVFQSVKLVLNGLKEDIKELARGRQEGGVGLLLLKATHKMHTSSSLKMSLKVTTIAVNRSIKDYISLFRVIIHTVVRSFT